MANPLSEIEIQTSLKLHRMGWFWQQTFRISLFLFIAGAAMGAFGNGFISRVEHYIATDFRIECENVARVHAESKVEIHALDGRNNETLPIVIPYALLEYYNLEDVWPEPLRQSSTERGIRYEFLRQPGSQIELTFLPWRPGIVRSQIEIGGDTFDFNQTILP